MVEGVLELGHQMDELERSKWWGCCGMLEVEIVEGVSVVVGCDKVSSLIPGGGGLREGRRQDL